MVNTIICCAIGSKSRFTCFYKSWIRQNAPPRIPLRVKIRGTKEYAGVVELVDSVDLGSSAKACRFESCRPHHLKTSLLIQSDVRKTSELSEVFLYPCTNFGLQSHISTLEIYKTPLS